MPRVLFGVSPIGLGHATRALVLGAELRRRGADVRMFTGGKAAAFLKGRGSPVDDVVAVPYFRVDGGEMRGVTRWYLSSWLAHRRNLKKARVLMEEYGPDVVVGDEEFSGVTVAGEEGVPRVLVADELELGFGRTWLARRVERRVDRWYKELQGSVDLLVVPETGEDSGNRKYVGPMVRPRTSTCPDVRAKYGIPGGRMVLLSMSGIGEGRELASRLEGSLRESWLSDASLVITGNRGIRFRGERVHDLGVVDDNQDLVACADLVVSHAGKSTIDEAESAGTPIIAIPIRHHAEQERNAGALGYSYEDVRRLPSLLRERIGLRRPPKSFTGEVPAADAILRLAAGR